jgi:hypothetical protein
MRSTSTKCVLLLSLTFASAACFTPQQLREKAQSMPDPRQAEADIIWASILTIVNDEEQWPVDLARRDDLWLATEWMEMEEGLRKRVRISVIIAPMGFGINVLVKHQRFDPEAPIDEKWREFSSPEISASEKAQEAQLVKRIHLMWQSNR